MFVILSFLQKENNIYLFLIGLCIFFIILLFIYCIFLTKRFNKFISNGNTSENLEKLLQTNLEKVQAVNTNYESTLASINAVDLKYLQVTDKISLELKKEIIRMEDKISFCIQKIGTVRYNPFYDMGGELCFAVALLDESDNGFIINAIHSRESSHTYCKVILNGQCSVTLSKEEQESLELAKQSLEKY